MRHFNVHLLPDLIDPQRLADHTVVVIDVLRATTTITYALAAGARQVIPCLEVEQARQCAAQCPPGTAALGGERQGIRIDGFDLGNSPTEYTTEKVGGKTVVFTTTNGTRAMERCRLARRVLLGALCNYRAVVAALEGTEEVDLICAGTRGEIGLDDALTAGAIAADYLVRYIKHPVKFNDQAYLVLDAWAAAEKRGVLAALRDSYGGRNLIAEGFEADIATAAKLDQFVAPPVPQLDVGSWTIRA